MKALFIVILISLSSCALNKKKAQELSSKGFHEEAIASWESAFLESSNDIEVLEGLRTSKEEIINKKLVTIRDMRIAKNYEAAINEFKKLVDLQSKWKTKTNLNSSQFQSIELSKMWENEKKSLDVTLVKNHPLASLERLKSNSNLFSSLREFDNYAEIVNKRGRENCLRSKKNNSNYPYYESFIIQYCNFFNNKRGIASEKVPLNINTYSNVQIKILINGVNDEMSKDLSAKLNKSFRESIWFSPESKNNAKLNLKGNYTWIPQKERINQAHSYTVQIPYSVEVPIMQTRQVPYQDSEYQCVYNQYIGNTCGNVTVTRYRLEYYTINQTVTHYRSEPRTYNYVANKNSQDFILNLSGNLELGTLKTPVTFSKHETEEKITHNYSMPEIGLSPSNEEISSPISVFNGFADNLSSNFSNDLISSWEQSFCVLPKERSIASIGENVIKCMKVSSDKKFIDEWFLKNHGVNAKEIKELIGEF